MKVRPSIKARCENCKIVKRQGVTRIICKNPRHKQRQGLSMGGGLGGPLRCLPQNGRQDCAGKSRRALSNTGTRMRHPYTGQSSGPGWRRAAVRYIRVRTRDVR